MKLTKAHITIFTLLIFCFQISAQNASPSKKESRLNMKVKPKKVMVSYRDDLGKKTSKSINFNAIEVPKTHKSVNQYFAEKLIQKPVFENNFETIVVTSKNNASIEKPEVKKQSNATNSEMPDKFFKADGIQISNVYPNPADDNGFFDYVIENKYNKIVKIVVYNAIGGMTNVNLILDKNSKKAKISLKSLPNGIYFYQLLADGKTLATKKLLVRHN